MGRLSLPQAPAAPGMSPVPAGLGDPCLSLLPDPARTILQSLFQGCCSKQALTPAQTAIPVGKQRPWGGAGEATFRGCCRNCSRAPWLPGSIPGDRVLHIIQVSQQMQHPPTNLSRILLSSPPGPSQFSREGSHGRAPPATHRNQRSVPEEQMVRIFFLSLLQVAPSGRIPLMMQQR